MIRLAENSATHVESRVREAINRSRVSARKAEELIERSLSLLVTTQDFLLRSHSMMNEWRVRADNRLAAIDRGD